jgi:hypothetical protein
MGREMGKSNINSKNEKPIDRNLLPGDILKEDNECKYLGLTRTKKLLVRPHDAMVKGMNHLLSSEEI